MRILVTGGNGFLGRHLQKLFSSQKIDIHINNTNLPDGVNFIDSSFVDLRNQIETNDLLFRGEFSHVIHLAAAVGGIGANQQNPGKFSYDNLIMGCNVIEACRTTYVEQLIFVGTVCSYPNNTKVPFKEEDLWNGYPEPTNAPYGIAKKALWSLLDGYYKQYGMKSAYLIPVNMYGEHDNFSPSSSHVIPALIDKVLKAHDKIDVWGTGSATREFVYAGDVAKAIFSSLNVVLKPDPINIGSGEEISMSDLVKLIISLCNKDIKIEYDYSKPDGQIRRLISSDRAKEIIGYTSSMSLVDGLYRTIQWYKMVTGL